MIDHRVRLIAAVPAAVLALTLPPGVLEAPAAAAPVVPATVTDLNGDGKVDIVSIFGARQADLAAYFKKAEAQGDNSVGFEYADPGSVSVAYGGGSRVDTVTQEQLGDVKGRVTSDSEGNAGWMATSWTGSFGSASLVADLNHDGYSDIVLGDPGANHRAGEVWVLWGSPNGISASGATRILQGASDGDLVGRALAYVAQPTPTLVVGDKHDADGTLFAYPVGTDGHLGAAQAITGLPINASGDAYALAASDDLMVVGAGQATVGGVLGAGAVVIARLQADGSWARQTLSQDTAGMPGKAETYDGFGFSVSVLNGYVAVSAPREQVGSAPESGQVQGFRVTGSGATISVAALSYFTPKNLGLFTHKGQRLLGYDVQVYRVCDGRYGVLMEADPGDPGGAKEIAVRAPFVGSIHCVAKVVTRHGWGRGFMSVLRTSPDGTKAEKAVLNTRPYQLKLVQHGHTTVTRNWTASAHPEFNLLVQAAS